MHDITRTFRKKRTNHKKGIAAAKKDQKRKEAAERQKKYDALTLDQKLAKAALFPQGREYARLVAKAAQGTKLPGVNS